MSSDHVILNYLDTPARFLFWPISEFMSVVVPFIVLVLCGCPVIGCVLSGGIAFGIRLFKRSFGKGMLEGILYRTMMHNRTKYPVTPPSYIREFIG